MLVVVFDSDRRVLRANQEFLDTVGCTMAEIAGEPLSRFLDQAGTCGSKLAACGPEGQWERVKLRNVRGETIEISLQPTRLRAAAGDECALVGELLPVQALGLEMLPGWQCLNSIEGAVMTEDARGNITFANERLLAMLGYEQDELVGKHWTAIVPPVERPMVDRQLAGRPEGVRSQYETVVIARRGMPIPVIVSARPVIQDGRYQGTVSTFTDITQRKETEEEIRSKNDRLEFLYVTLEQERQKLSELADHLTRANEQLRRLSDAKSDFVAAVSHDLRTPLTTITEGIRLTEDGALGPVSSDQREFLRMAREDAQRLGDLIDDLLDIARIERGRLALHPARVIVQTEVRRVQASYVAYAREKGLAMAVELPEAPLAVVCDPQHYYRILVNLVSNAVKYTPAGGRIVIRTSTGPDGMILTAVEDTGIGIPRDQQRHIFGKFIEIRRAGAVRSTGSGLGLALCRELVEANRGRIGFTSEEHSGSRFFFALPAADPAQPTPERKV
jgi:two-component system cell cycle sensor histidine kinase PleC